MWGFLISSCRLVLLMTSSFSEDMGVGGWWDAMIFVNLLLSSLLWGLQPHGLNAGWRGAQGNNLSGALIPLFYQSKEKVSIPETCTLFSSRDYLWDFTREVPHYQFQDLISCAIRGIWKLGVMSHSRECLPSSYASFLPCYQNTHSVQVCEADTALNPRFEPWDLILLFQELLSW